VPKALIPILAITAVDVLGFTILIPLLPFYAEKYGATPFIIGAIYATVALFSLVSSPFWGRISDKIGRKGVLLVSQIAAFIAFVLLGIGGSLTIIFIARAIEGIGGGTIGVTQAYVADVTEPKDRAKAFGLVGATFGFGFLIGPALAGYLVRFGYPVPLFTAAGLALVTVFLTIFLLPESKQPVAAAPSIAQIVASLRMADLGTLLRSQFFFSLAFAMWVSVFALFAERALNFNASQTSTIFVVSAVVGIVVQAGLIGRLVDRFGEGRLAMTGFASLALGYGSVFFVHTLAALLVIVFFWSLGGALLRPTMSSLISQNAPADQRGTILGVNDSLGNVAFVISPFISTKILSLDANWVGFAPAIMALIGLAIGYRLFMRPKSLEAVAH
jgi:DHA1 family tetracycline resistance protein-like MFS transporter